MQSKMTTKKVLKIYIDNTDKYQNEPLWKYILTTSKELNLDGATVYKAVAGVGRHNQIHTFDIFNLSNEMPIVIEIIDTETKIENFLKTIEPSLKEAFVTIHSVETINFKA